MIKATWPTFQPNLLVLDTREAILDLAPLLQILAERCGQSGAMHWLPYFLHTAVSGRRIPYLVLMLRPEEHQGHSLCAEDVEAAALFFEYRILGLRTGAVAPADAVGFSSVIAPRGQRMRMAAIAARALVERGADIVLATYEGESEPDPRGIFSGLPGVLSTARERTVRRALRLQPTFEATVAQMGRRTRLSLRYYRRRLEAQLQCEFVVEAGEVLRNADLEAINRSSLNPLPAAEFERRIRCASDLPDSFLCGLRAADGRWLSLMGGWRQGKTTVLHWQMNAAGFERHSLGTAMRSFLLEHEVGRGSEKLVLYGETPHSMGHAFEPDTVGDVIVRRRSLHAAVLRWGLQFFAAPKSILGQPNFLASALRDPSLQWTPGIPPPRAPRPVLGKTSPSQRPA